MMKFITLGSFEVWGADGQRLELGRGRPRQLLAMVLLQPNTTVTYGALTDGLWDEPPRSAMANLRSYACAVRRLLGSAGEHEITRFSTEPGGYRFAASADELDLLAWSELLTAGLAAHHAGQTDAAVSKLTQAGELWHGPPFGGLQLHGPFSARLTSLHEQHIEAKEIVIEARLELGAHRDLVGELRSLVGEHPLRERLWAHLMLALYRSGRQSEALRAYHEVRQKLVTEVGVEPGPELQSIERAILTATPDLHHSRSLG